MNGNKRLGLVLLDAVLVNLAFYSALLLRFEGHIPQQYLTNSIYLLPWLTFISLGFFVVGKLYRRIWEYASIKELMSIVAATSLSVASLFILSLALSLPPIPRSVYLLTWLLMNVYVGVFRLSWRLMRDTVLKRRNSKGSCRRVLIVGAGDAGAMLVKEIQNNPQLRLETVGLVDDDSSKQKMILGGIKVLGGRKKIPEIAAKLDADEIIIAMPSVNGGELRDIVNICRQTKLRVRILPGIYQSSQKKLLFSLRDLQMEDLLRRESVQVDLEEIASYISKKSVLVTGAGGSIGAELCRQLNAYSPDRLICLDCCENNLFEIEMELNQHNGTRIIPVLADVRDQGKMEAIFSRDRPQVVFHAAAYKHVPMMERHPEEAFANNVIGTRNTAALASAYGVETFIMVSTDKAVNPTSVMGASKRVAELIVKDINRLSPTKFASVRFGNVLGSRGSAIPIFMKQISKGGPVTITHPEMKRYFMTIAEAVQLMIQAGAMAAGGETFVLDMGEPVKIQDLARDLIRISGFEPDIDIELIYTGIRPGEKLFEELFTIKEEMAATKHERIYISNKEIDEAYINIGARITAITKAGFGDQKDIIDLITRLIPEYQGKRVASG